MSLHEQNSNKPNKINLVKLEKITHIGDKPKPVKPKLTDMPAKKEIEQPVKKVAVVNPKEHLKENLGLFQKFIVWLLNKNKGKVIAALVVALRQIVYPFDVYKVNNKGEWVLDETKSPEKVAWASNIAKGGSMITFALAYLFNDPVKDFTGKGVIEWLQLLLN
jgi:hypothetical protein